METKTKRKNLQEAPNRELYFNTVHKLRSRNFGNGLPFLILSDKLPDGQVYREFADGRIEVQPVIVVGAEYKFKVLKILDSGKADKVRSEYGLL